jgi:UvrD-like helicase C-terminal domain
MRRTPNRSMTLVGDVAQTGAAGGARSWGEVLSPYVEDRWRLEQLTVNYRTPAEIMAVAARVLAEVDPSLSAPSSVRETGVPPWSVRTGDLAAELPGLAARELSEVDGGTVAVLVPAARFAAVSALLADHDERLSVLTVERSKGLEFDSVVLVAPDEVVAGSPRGLNDLYVALTRATQRLAVVHDAALPPVLHRLAE